jgi:hypothetical protein
VYTHIWKKITWSMEGTKHWNLLLLLLLPTGGDSNKKLEFL